jgi:hypothetical protein
VEFLPVGFELEDLWACIAAKHPQIMNERIIQFFLEIEIRSYLYGLNLKFEKLAM